MIFLILFFVNFIYASTPGETTFTFLKIPVGAKATSLAEACLTEINDPFAIYYNPANLAQSFNNQIALSHLEYLESIRYDNLTAIFKIKNFYKIGFSLGLLYTTDLNKTISSETMEGFESLGDFSFYNFISILANSFKISHNSSFGINLKFINEKIDKYQNSNLAFDFGYFRKIKNNLNWAFSILNIAPSSKFIKEKEISPICFKTGFAIFVWKINLNLDLQKYYDSPLTISSGLQAKFFDILFIRTGYKFKFEKKFFNNFTAGLGIKINKFNIDYALATYNILGLTHTISLIFNF